MDFFRSMWETIKLSPFAIPELNITTVIDILVMAVVSYKVMLWIKETRAWSLFKGVVVILAVYLLSQILNLYAVKFIIENMFLGGILVVIIVFQPEIRRALEQIGKGGIMEIFSSNEKTLQRVTTDTIDNIITAAKKMSAEKTGALILIEGEVAVGELKSTGIPIEAAVSSQLLLNIFVNKTPLHDGAVIIANNKIAAATCILPLTSSSLTADLGTRHRAAVGASENSDAYVLVVSEETGTISIAKDGKLFRNLDEIEIREMISNNIKPKPASVGISKGRRK